MLTEGLAETREKHQVEAAETAVAGLKETEQLREELEHARMVR